MFRTAQQANPALEQEAARFFSRKSAQVPSPIAGPSEVQQTSNKENADKIRRSGVKLRWKMRRCSQGEDGVNDKEGFVEAFTHRRDGNEDQQAIRYAGHETLLPPHRVKGRHQAKKGVRKGAQAGKSVLLT